MCEASFSTALEHRERLVKLELKVQELEDFMKQMKTMQEQELRKEVNRLKKLEQGE